MFETFSLNFINYDPRGLHGNLWLGVGKGGDGGEVDSLYGGNLFQNSFNSSSTLPTLKATMKKGTVQV